MKALLALQSVGFCVGQSQMCLKVCRYLSSFFFVFMQQKFSFHSVVVFFLGLLVTARRLCAVPELEAEGFGSGGIA